MTRSARVSRGLLAGSGIASNGVAARRSESLGTAARDRNIGLTRSAVAETTNAAAMPTRKTIAKAPEPVSAAKLTSLQIRAALKRARRRDIDTKVERIQGALRSEQLGRHKLITGAYAATTRSAPARSPAPRGRRKS
ncbi:MAG: hypothetical protein K2X97_19910 [Mycobacteriaceae bacterium]|nr:hypothetical protein [Mycobacteriaceae bacterium]